MAEMADLCREADSGSEDFRAKAYNTVRHILKLSSKYGFSGNLWQSAVALYIAYNENPFSLSAERAEEKKDDIFARRDCRLLEEIFCYDPAVLDEKLGNDCFCLLKNYSSIQPLSDSGRVCLLYTSGLRSFLRISSGRHRQGNALQRRVRA